MLKLRRCEQRSDVESCWSFSPPFNWLEITPCIMGTKYRTCSVTYPPYDPHISKFVPCLCRINVDTA